jgi:hypothetical protein
MKPGTCPSCKGGGVLPTRRGNNEVCPNCGGIGQKMIALRVPFDYVFNTAALTALQQGLGVPLTFDFDADFEHIFTVANSTGLFSVQLQDRSTNRTLSNNPVNGENYAGTAALPFPLVEPYVWARASTALATFNDRSNASNSVQLCFKGYKLYPATAPQQGSAGTIIPSGS